MNEQHQDIAIIGMAGIYPGAPTVQRFWHNIFERKETVTDTPPSWQAEVFHDPEADGEDNEHTYCRRGGYIDEFADFDPMAFGTMPGSVDGSDPEQFLALRVAREALKDAGYLDRPFDRERTGVILGHGSYMHRGFMTLVAHVMTVPLMVQTLRDVFPNLPQEVWPRIRQDLKEALPSFAPDNIPGLVSNVIAGRIANRLDLMGPNYLVDAACASSLIAVDAGIRELRAGRCSMALVGGSQVNNNALISVMFSMLGALSKKGRCRPFSAEADGTLLGEGIGMAVLKRREDAERDGDRIYALVKGVGISSDGRAQTMLAPRLEGEIQALRRAYADSGIDPDSVELVEAHGTATPVGDRTEAEAMGAVFGAPTGPVRHRAVGSVKSMISHTIPAAGMAGLFKTALALHHKVLPPTLCDTPHPELGIERSSLFINTDTRPWIHGLDTPRRAGVSAFGFGGINSHAILEEYNGPEPGGPGIDWDSELFLFEGPDRPAIRKQMERLSDNLEPMPSDSFATLARAQTLSGPADKPSARCLAIVAHSMDDLKKKMAKADRFLSDENRTTVQDRSGIFYAEDPMRNKGRVAFLLPGEGSQYPGMLKDLCLHIPTVRAWFDRADRACRHRHLPLRISQLAFPPSHLTPAEQDALDRARWDLTYAVTLTLTADCALTHLLLSLGIQPDAFVGHSTAQDLAIEAASYLEELTEQGAAWRAVLEDRVLNDFLPDDTPQAVLMSVGACDYREVYALAEASDGLLKVAMDNCPNQVVLCGDTTSIGNAREQLTAQGAVCDILPFDRAVHTPAYRDVCRALETVAPNSFFESLHPRLPVYSSTTGRLCPEQPGDIRRLLIDQWAEPVRFRETVETMYEDGIRIFIEAGPRGNLSAFVRDTLADRDVVCASADLPNRSGTTQLHHLLGCLAAHGVHWDRNRLYALRGEEAQPADEATARPTVPLKFDIPLPRLSEDHCKALKSAMGTRPKPAAERDGRSRILAEHFKTMEQFLTTQRDVMARLHNPKDPLS